MDNKEILVQSEGKNSFDLAVKLFFCSKYDNGEPRVKVSHYAETQDGLAFLWHHSESLKSIKLPVLLDWKGAADLAWEWLMQQPKEKYQEPYDGDGSSGQGFKVFNVPYKDNYITFIVVPVFAWYGK